jgi:hypothetical protein
MGKVQLAVRFSSPAHLPDTVEPDDPKEEFDAVPRRPPPLLQIPPLETARVEEDKLTNIERRRERERGEGGRVEGDGIWAPQFLCEVFNSNTT